MNDLKIFTYGESRIRTFEKDGEMWFVGKDVADVLGYSNTKDAVANHVDEEDKRILQRSEIATFENHIPESALLVNFVSAEVPNRGLTIINESGLYSLILSSKLPDAKAFKHWVTSEVLPTIRKTGGYTAPWKKSEQELAAADRRAAAMLLNAKARAAKEMRDLWDLAGVEPQYQALALNGYYDGLKLPREALSGAATALLDKTTIAANLGVLSKSRKPHAQAIGAIIGTLPIEASERALTPYCRNGHDGVDEQFTESVQDKVAAWLHENGNPAKISIGNKTYSIRYE